MTSLDDLLRRSADAPQPSAGFVTGILERVCDDRERRGLLRLFTSSLLVALTLLLTCDLSARTSLELIGRKWPDLLGGFYEEPLLLLSREGWLAILEHLFHGSIPFLAAAVFLFGLTIWRFWRVYSSLPLHFHALR